MRAFRFGVTLFPIMASRAGWLDSVRRVEASGFSVLTVTDHFHNSGGVWSSLVAAYDAAPGIEKRSPGTRIERLGEALRILRPALSGEPVRFEGAHYRVDGGAPW